MDKSEISRIFTIQHTTPLTPVQVNFLILLHQLQNCTFPIRTTYHQEIGPYCSVRQTKRKQIVENEHRHTRHRFKSTQILYLQISSDWSSVLLCGYYSCNTSSLVSWYSQQRIVITFPFFFQVFGQLGQQVSYCRMMTSGSPVNQMPLESIVQW